jgi:hypothetical protein
MVITAMQVQAMLREQREADSEEAREGRRTDAAEIERLKTELDETKRQLALAMAYIESQAMAPAEE